MTITVTGFQINDKSHEVIIFADNVDSSYHRYINREQDVMPAQVSYTFDTTQERVFKYLTNWLKRQKRVSDNIASIKTYGDAFTLLIGIVTTSPSLSYCHREYIH